MNLVESSSILKVHNRITIMMITIIVMTDHDDDNYNYVDYDIDIWVFRMQQRREIVGSQQGEQASAGLRMFIRWT